MSIGYEEIFQSIADVQQPRSTFQIKHFVLGQHRTAEMQYYQTCIELQDMIYKYEIAKIEVKKLELKIKRLIDSKDEMKLLKAEAVKLELKQMGLAMLGAEREIRDLVDIFEGFETKYTRAEIEAAQPEYWNARLTGNAKAMLMGGTSVNAAHIEAMEQAGVLDNFVEEVQQSKRELGI